MKGNMSLDDIGKFREFVKWRREKPEEWKQFIKDFKETMLELAKVMEEIMEEMG